MRNRYVVFSALVGIIFFYLVGCTANQASPVLETSTPEIYVWVTLTPLPTHSPTAPIIAMASPSPLATLVNTPSVTHIPTNMASPSETPPVTTSPTNTRTPTKTPLPSPTLECQPTDQDDYVFDPRRLQVLRGCVIVTGVVKETFVNKPDGDAIIDLIPDPPYVKYLTQGNFNLLEGALHLEIICYVKGTIFGTALCPKNKTALLDPLPRVGERIRAEGRWVLDKNKIDAASNQFWAELHPVYRWSVIK